jgi:hypothetical protein
MSHTKNKTPNEVKPNKVNYNGYNYEIASESSLTRARTSNGPDNRLKSAKQINNSRYQYEFGHEYYPKTAKTARANNANAKDSALARGANIAGAFTNPLPSNDASSMKSPYMEEFADPLGQDFHPNVKPTMPNQAKTKKSFQDTLKQNYNVEFAKEDLVCDNCGNRCNGK